MPVREASEVAARVARLHGDAFAGKRTTKPVCISQSDFYRVADRTQLREAFYKEVAATLLKKHHLLLGRADTFFIVVSSEVCSGWLELRKGFVSIELKKKPPTLAATYEEAALSPAAAWPFPVKKQANPAA